MRRFLSIWLPYWPIESRLRDRNQETIQQTHSQQNDCTERATDIFAYRPFALTQSGAKGIIITAVNQVAILSGITKGMSLTDARALSRDLVTEKATPTRDNSRLKQLALWCLRFSPLVTTRGPDDILIDITGCAHLFGGEEAMMASIANHMKSFTLTARFGLADTIGAAWAAAHYAQSDHTIIAEQEQEDFLAALPVSALRLETGITQRLNQLGLHQIKEVLRIPQAPLTARFGTNLVTRLQQATGKAAEVLNPLQQPPDYELRHAFIEPVRNLELISVALGDLTQKMAGLLTAKKKGARRFHLRLFRVDGHMEQISVGTSRICHEASHMLLLFQEKLSSLGAEIDAGFGYDLMTLSAFEIETRQDEQSAWTTSTENLEENFNKLLDRLSNRLGVEQINHWQPAQSHIPERAFKYVTMTTPTASSGKEASNNASRPLLLLAMPTPITVLAEVPDGPPIRFEWRNKQHHIIAANGPERLAPEWWRHDLEGSQQTRDYYYVEDQDGHRFWLYRDGLYERPKDQPRWFIHGFFA
ncbi:MAG: DNA polymerase Y family protein [Sneathiella sp.]|nr:DNA polymerase Y family protein [Sneathiella sp.]